ncbi:MAG: hypothetical protein ACYCSO_05125 [Cuniculiplasma sp.]
MGIIEADIQSLMNWTGSQISSFLLTWGNSFAGGGVLIPAIVTLVIGITLIGSYGVLTLIDGGKSMVGE